MKPTDVVKAAFLLPFRATGWAVRTAVIGRVIKQQTGSQFQKPAHVRRWLSSWNTGLLLDGVNARLSERESYQNVCVIAPINAGKTSRYIIPNVLDRANAQCSIVVNDPKGEVFEATSAAMAKAGYRVIVIDPQHPHLSHRFNPLAEARDEIQLEQIADIMVRCGNPNARDPFWNNGAVRMVNAMLKALRNAAQTSDPGTFNLANLYRLLQNFGRLGMPLQSFMARACANPQNPADRRLWDEWNGAITGNPEGVQSFVLNALTALKSFSNANMAWLTAESDFNLEDLRRDRTIIYFITPPQLAGYYGFFTSVFFQSVFNAAMHQMPGKRDLPIYVLYDEFGHSTLPEFAAIANTIRAYKVSLSIVLQSIAQLSHRYGVHAAQALQGGFNTVLTYRGSDPETCKFFEARCGRVRERQRRNIFDPNPQDQYREYNLLNADEVRRIADDEAVLVSTNRMPARIRCKGFFESGFARMAKRGAIVRPPRQVNLSAVPLVRL